MALLYDTIAAFTVVYFAGFVPVMAGGGEALAPGNWAFALYALAAWFGYFALCWRRGRTLGMQAWKLVIVGADGQPPSWRAIVLRFAAAPLALAPAGLGYLWSLLDRDGLCWHERLSGTRLLRQPPAR